MPEQIGSKNGNSLLR